MEKFKDVSDKYKKDKKLWSSTINNLEKKIKVHKGQICINKLLSIKYKVDFKMFLLTVQLFFVSGNKRRSYATFTRST